MVGYDRCLDVGQTTVAGCDRGLDIAQTTVHRCGRRLDIGQTTVLAGDSGPEYQVHDHGVSAK